MCCAVFYKPKILISFTIKKSQAHLSHDRDQSFLSIWALAVPQKNQTEKRKQCHSKEEYEMTYKLL